MVLREGGVHDGRGPPDRTGQGVAAGDADRDRLDERAQRHEVGVGRDQLIRDPDADLGRDVVVLAQLLDVVDERGPVEHVAVDVAGDHTERSEEGAEDEEDACRPPSTARRARRVAPGWPVRDVHAIVRSISGGVGNGQGCSHEQEDASEPDAQSRGAAAELAARNTNLGAADETLWRRKSEAAVAAVARCCPPDQTCGGAQSENRTLDLRITSEIRVVRVVLDHAV